MKLVWNAPSTRIYQTGLSKGVLYLKNRDGSYQHGVAWNGLVSVTESPKGAEANPFYANDSKYLNLYSVEEFEATVEAYTYPDEFMECNGDIWIMKGGYAAQQPRRSFGFCYRTIIGNDTLGELYGYKIHIIYNCKASTTEMAHQTQNESPEPLTFSWTISTIPVELDERKVSHIVIDSRKADPEKLKMLEDALYGSDISYPYLPSPSEIIAIMGHYTPPEPDPEETYISGVFPLLDEKRF